MPDADQLDVRVREVSATDLDAIRPIARQCGYRQTVADLVRFAVALAANISRLVSQRGGAPGAGDDVPWPRRVRNLKNRRPGPVREPVESPGFNFP